MSSKFIKLQPNIRKAKPATTATAPVAPVVNPRKEKKAKTRVEELMLEMSING